jgi:hypothetical protein
VADVAIAGGKIVAVAPALGARGHQARLFSLRAGRRVDVDSPLLPQPIPIAA